MHRDRNGVPGHLRQWRNGACGLSGGIGLVNGLECASCEVKHEIPAIKKHYLIVFVRWLVQIYGMMEPCR